MARITSDDCLRIIPNRFDMTLSATFRARQLAHGAAPMVEVNRDKPTVIALRELAAGKYGIEILAKNRTAPKVLPVGATTNDDWRRITEPLAHTAEVENVSAELEMVA